MIFLIVLILTAFIWLYLFFSSPLFRKWEANWKAAQLRKNEAKNQPKSADRKHFAPEERIAIYRQLFRNGPVGEWTNPFDTFSRLVSYEDWQFNADGTGKFIFYTIGGGIANSHFQWQSTGDFKIHIVAVKAPDEVAEKDGYFASFIPNEWDFSYRFDFLSEDSNQVTLQSDTYFKGKKTTIGEIGLLCLAGGSSYGEMKSRLER